MKRRMPLFHQSIKMSTEEIEVYEQLKKSDVKTPSPWQMLAEGHGKNVRHMIYSAPGGCGKTLLAVIISMGETIRSKNTRRHLFIAPTIEIGEGFCNPQGEKIKILYEGKERIWEVPEENKFNSDNQKSIKGLKSFLLSSKKHPYNELHLVGPYATATHMGMGKIWKELSNEEKCRALRNITIHIDECHHSNSNVLDPTQLGTFVRDICEIDEPTCNLNLYTATLYRTDKGDIVPITYQDKFLKWEIPLHHYLSIIKIEEFNFQFTHYRKDPLTQIIRYMKEHKKQKHIVILPARGDRFRTEGTLNKYLKQIYKIYKPSRVLDLITDRTQKKNMKLLRENNKGYDVVIACRLFTEGTDWPPASVLHNTSYGVSQVHFTQMMFRIFRRYEGKKKIWLYVYMPPPLETATLRVKYTDRLNLILATVIMSDLCAAINIPLIPTAPFYNDRKGITSLSEVMGHDLYAEMKHRIIITYDHNRKKDTPKEIEMRLEIIAKDYYHSVEESMTFPNFKLAVKTIFIRIIKLARNKRIEHINIDFIRKQGFDKILKQNKLGSIVYGTGEPLTPRNLYQLRDIMVDALVVAVEVEKNSIVSKLKKFDQDHIVEKTPIKKPIQSIKDLKGKWVVFNIPPKAKIRSTLEDKYSDHGRVLEQEGLQLTVALYEGEIIIEKGKIVLVVNPGLIYKDREEKFIYCDNFWRSDDAPPTLTPSNSGPELIKYFLFEGNIFPGRKKAPYITVKISYQWVKHTL